MELLGATNKAHRGHAITIFVERIVCGGNNVGMIGKAEIVVGAKVDGAAICCTNV